MRAERAVALITDEEQGHRRIADERLDVLDDPPAGDHPIRGEDHKRSHRLLDGEGLLRAVRHDGIGVIDDRVAARDQRPRIVVEVVEVCPVHIAGLLSHRRIEVERQVRNGSRFEQPVQLVDDLLRPADRERRHEQHPLGVTRQLQRFAQEADGLLLRLVRLAAIRRFDEQPIRSRDRGGVADDRRAGTADVAAEDDDPLLVPIHDADADDRRAQDVAGVEIRRGDARRDLHFGAVVDAVEEPERRVGLVDRVQRLAQCGDRGRRRVPRRRRGILLCRGRELGHGLLVLDRRPIRIFLGEALVAL